MIYANQAYIIVKKREVEEQGKEIKKWIYECRKLRTAYTKAYKLIHRQLELVWALMRVAGCFLYKDN